MLELKDGFIFYHGSYCEVKEPDLTQCAKRKDFGQGFYLTTSKEQAENFLKTAIVKAVAAGKIQENQNYGYISTFELQLSRKLEICIFENGMLIGCIVLLPIERKSYLLKLNMTWKNMMLLQVRLRMMQPMLHLLPILLVLLEP